MNSAKDTDFLELVSFMLVSARNLISEPPRYGPLRLVEAAKRLIGVLEGRGIANEPLRDVAHSASDMPALLMRSEEEFVESLDGLIDAVSARLAAASQEPADHPPSEPQ